jgi:hypothetical protein
VGEVEERETKKRRIEVVECVTKDPELTARDTGSEAAECEAEPALPVIVDDVFGASNPFSYDCIERYAAYCAGLKACKGVMPRNLNALQDRDFRMLDLAAIVDYTISRVATTGGEVPTQLKLLRDMIRVALRVAFSRSDGVRGAPGRC